MAAQHPSRRTPALLRYIQKHARRVSGAADGQQLGADDWSEGKRSVSGNSEMFEELPEQRAEGVPGQAPPAPELMTAMWPAGWRRWSNRVWWRSTGEGSAAVRKLQSVSWEDRRWFSVCE
jgi:hypothetical protein